MPNHSRERIILTGQSGSGKTYAILTLARFFPERSFYVFDLDDGFERVWNLEFPDVRNIDFHLCMDWKTLIEEFNAIKPQPADFVAIDMLNRAWEMVQSYYIDEVFEKDRGEYFLQVRKSLRSGAQSLGALRGWVDWNVINSLYQDFANRLFYSLRCNVIATCSYSAISDEDDKEVQAAMSASGYNIRLDGQKHTIFRGHTVLLLRNNKLGRTVSTIKDRGRPPLVQVPWHDIAIDYLVKVAGY